MKILPHDLFRNPFWWWHAFKKGINIYKIGFNFDVVHCHDLDTLAIGVLLKKKLGVKLVYDAHEIFGYMVLRDNPKIVSKVAFFLEKRLLGSVDYIILAENTYKKYFSKVTNKPMITVMNCKELIIEKYKKPDNDIFTLIYIGVLNKSRFFPELIDVIGKIERVHLVIAGKKENMYNDIMELSKKYSNIKFIGPIPYSDVLNQTLAGDAVLCMINPSDINNRIASANKQFEAMVCGRPIICVKGTRSGQITEEENCGLVVEYSKDALMEAVVKLRDSPELYESLGRNALKAAKNTYNWKKENQKLIEVYRKIEKAL
jgi:glycosyltransferase involved in cell wall biosynthesis